MKSLLWRVIPLAIWIVAVVLLGDQLTVRTATWAGVLGCGAAFWLGARIAASKVRLWVPWACVLPVQGLIVLLASVLRGADLTASVMGPANAYVLSAVVLWFGSATLWIGVFQASSRRMPPFVALEAAAITLVVAAIFAQHRDAFINRPFFLVDPLWAKGYDPLPIFLAIGGCVAAVLILLLASKSAAASRRSMILEVGLLMALMLIIFTVFPSGEIKKLRDLQTGGQAGDKGAQASPTPGDGQGGRPSPDPNGSPMGGQRPGGSPTPKGGRGDAKDNDTTELRDDDFSKKKGSNQSNEPVAVVLLRDDYTPPDGYYYFRQTVFSEYNGQRVVRDNGSYDKDVSDAFPIERPIDLPIEHAGAGTTRRLQTTVALIHSHTRPFGLVNVARFTSVNNPDPTHFQRAYDVDSQVLTVPLQDMLRHEVGSPSWSKDTWDHYLAAPSDPRYKKLSIECLQMLRPEMRDEPLARAIAVKLWLDENGTYDLTSKYENSQDPVGDFLFGDRVGYCVSFAHAAVALFRTVGVPARVGTGYAVDARFKGRGSALLIRSNAAHAWPEIYLDDVGWVVLDIAPKKSLVKPADPPDSSQQDLYGDLARKKNKQKMPDQNPMGNGNMQRMMADLLKALGWGLLLGLALVFLGLYGMKIWRRMQPGFATPSALPLVAYRSALDVLADHGRLRRFGQSREAFAREVADITPSLGRLTQLHLERSLGRGDKPAERAELLNLYHTVRSEVAAHATLRRRVLAVLNPFGWWLVK